MLLVFERDLLCDGLGGGVRLMRVAAPLHGSRPAKRRKEDHVEPLLFKERCDHFCT